MASPPSVGTGAVRASRACTICDAAQISTIRVPYGRHAMFWHGLDPDHDVSGLKAMGVRRFDFASEKKG